jgi:lactoylglutathione lyase
MSKKNNPSDIPSRVLYTMVRVTDLDRSVAFYRDALGMRELRRETFTEERFTLVFMGYSDEAPHAVIELTYNWDKDSYELGTGYGHVALEVADIYAACERLAKLGVNIVRAPGPMAFGPDETGEREVIAFIEDPDGYKIELIESTVS